MEVVSQNDVFQGFMPVAQPAHGAAAERRRHAYALLSIVGLAVVLRLYGIALDSLAGDEYLTIREAQQIGLNWNSIIYSILMHFWVRLATSEFWLRLPAAIFGIATVVLLFKIGIRLGGWRAGIAAGLLAATSPFNIYHSQEVRFYSMFMMATAAFMLTTITYVDSPKSKWGRLSIVFTAALLIVSHFLGVIALYAQGVAAFMAAKKRRVLTILAVTCGPALLLFGAPLFPPVRQQLFHLYQAFGNAADPGATTNSVSLISLAKVGFAGFVYIFGYHVYPLRLVLVIPGLVLCSVLLVRGTQKLLNERRWAIMPLTYLMGLIGIYLVLDALGGHVANGVAPRHAAFIWPAFLILLALGLSSFTRKTFQFLLVAMLAINSISLWLGWQRDWTYGFSTDYRAASSYVLSSADENTAVIVDGRSTEAAVRYFPNSIPLIRRWPNGPELSQLSYQRLLLVTGDWRPEGRQRSDELIARMAENFSIIDGRVDYPLFQYVFERKTAAGGGGTLPAETGQLFQPMSAYGIEFQDLKLPATVTVSSASLKVMGAYSLPNSVGVNNVTISLQQPTRATKLVLLTNVVGANEQAGTPIAEITVESKNTPEQNFPLRINHETASWGETCSSNAPCKTVFQWHKRIAITGQNSYPEAWRDFQAGLHGVVLNLPAGTEVTNLSIRYLGGSGRFYLWGVALQA